MSEQTPEVETTEHEVAEHEVAEHEVATRQERRDEHVRTRLKEVEAERDTLRERLDQRDRAHVEAEARRVLGDKGMHLFRVDDLADVRDPETGDVDPDRLAELLTPIREALDEGRTVHHGDMGPKATTRQKRGPSWGDFISARR